MFRTSVIPQTDMCVGSSYDVCVPGDVELLGQRVGVAGTVAQVDGRAATVIHLAHKSASKAVEFQLGRAQEHHDGQYHATCIGGAGCSRSGDSMIILPDTAAGIFR
jgi:hypothetical protein